MKEQTDTAAFEGYCQEHGRCLGVAVEELRTDKGLTRSEVARRANVSIDFGILIWLTLAV